MGTEKEGPGKLLQNGQISRVMASYVGENRLFEKMYLDGLIELELIP
jgi:acyl CoA:acetate/3-ketoacid CoA transferase alpha subunit